MTPTSQALIGWGIALGLAGAGGIWALLHVAVKLTRVATLMEAALGALGPRVTHVEGRADRLEDGHANHETRIVVLERMAEQAAAE